MLYYIGIFSKFGTHENKIWREDWAMCISDYLDAVAAGGWDERGNERMPC